MTAPISSSLSRATASLSEVAQGAGVGLASVFGLVEARRMAAGREPLEVHTAISLTLRTMNLSSDIAEAALGRRILPVLPWTLQTAIDLLALGTAPLLKALEARGAHRSSQALRGIARGLTAISLSGLLACVITAALIGRMLHAASAACSAALAIAVEGGWVSASIQPACIYLINGAQLLSMALSGAWIALGLNVLLVSLHFRAGQEAKQAAATTPAQFRGLEENEVRRAIEHHLQQAVAAVDPEAPSSSHSGTTESPFAGLQIAPAAMAYNYHGLAVETGVVDPSSWEAFEWPEWLSKDQSEAWANQMRGALARKDADRADLPNKTPQELWEEVSQAFRAGILSIANKRSNGGAILDWRPAQAAVQELLNQVHAAVESAHRDRIRYAICGLVGRLQACGAGVETAVQEAVRDDLQGAASEASEVLRYAANFRQAVVQEIMTERMPWVCSVFYGQVGVHALEDAALALPELNLPTLPLALRDVNAVQPFLWFPWLLRFALSGSKLEDPTALIEAVGLDLSAKPETVGRWLDQRISLDTADNVKSYLSDLPIASFEAYPLKARDLFFHHLAAAMLLDVGMLHPALTDPRL